MGIFDGNSRYSRDQIQRGIDSSKIGGSRWLIKDIGAKSGGGIILGSGEVGAAIGDGAIVATVSEGARVTGNWFLVG